MKRPSPSLATAARSPSVTTTAEVFERVAGARQRLTRTRRAVIEALHRAGRPVTARELHEAVRDVDLVTIYRTLTWLQELNLARQVMAAAGAERYELVHGDGHAHHLLCERCGSLATVIECGLDDGVGERIRQAHGFTVTRHTLTFHGLCADCAGL